MCTPPHRVVHSQSWQDGRGKVIKLGEGGFGVVYKVGWVYTERRPVRRVPRLRSAVHTSVLILHYKTIQQALQHGVDEVAVKKIRSLSPSLAQLRTFHYEVDCLRRLCHRNIVQVR